MYNPTARGISPLTFSLLSCCGEVPVPCCHFPDKQLNHAPQQLDYHLSSSRQIITVHISLDCRKITNPITSIGRQIVTI